MMYKRFAAVLVAFMCVFSVAATNSVRRAVPRAAGAAGGDAVCVKISVAGAAGVGGTIIAQLNPTTAPITVKNFLAYVDKQYYSNTIFHRVIKSFMVQGGGFTPDFYHENTSEKQGQGSPIKNEAGDLNTRGTLSMARTNDPDSATSQFFINTVDNASLDKSASSAGYAVFGKVVSGMDVVDKIESQQTTTIGSFADVPTTPIMMKEVARSPCA
jgi:peptidyl-prolyl cis-trans isomerase A (cyclophilin A)